MFQLLNYNTTFRFLAIPRKQIDLSKETIILLNKKLKYNINKIQLNASCQIKATKNNNKILLLYRLHGAG